MPMRLANKTVISYSLAHFKVNKRIILAQNRQNAPGEFGMSHKCIISNILGQFLILRAILNADSNRTFFACVLMIDSVMPFRSGFAHGGH